MLRRSFWCGVRSLLIYVSCLIAAAGPAAAAGDAASSNPKRSDEQIVDDLSTYLKQLAAKDGFSGSVLLAKGDKILFKGAYGHANHAFNAPNTVDTKFNLGSMGKMFTGVAILQLVEQGKLSLDSKLIEVVPDYPDQDIARKITIHQLLTHTSGLGNMFNQKFEDTPRHRLDTIAAHLPLFVGEPLQFEPGTRFSYSNAGFIVLGLVIERVSGETYYDYVREHIFEPTGMINTDNYHPHDDVPNLALGYTRMMGPGTTLPRPSADGKPAPRITNSDFMHRGASSGNGFSTVEDLLRFSLALQGYKLLNEANTELMMSGKVAMDRGGGKYGYAMIEAIVNGVRIVGHSGGAPGINSKLDMYRDLGYTVAVMSNYDGGTRPVIDRLQRALTGQEPPSL